MSVAYDVPPSGERSGRRIAAAVLPFARRVPAQQGTVDGAPTPDALRESSHRRAEPSGRRGHVVRNAAYAPDSMSTASFGSVAVDAPVTSDPVPYRVRGTALRPAPSCLTPTVAPAEAPGATPGRTVRRAGESQAPEPWPPESDPALTPRLRRQPATAATADAPVPGLRLTVRGRRLVAALSALALAGAVWITVAAVQSRLTQPLIPSSAPGVVTVHPGDTLWTIAERLAPQRDPRAVVAALRDRNHLPSASVRTGQRLVVPR